jgi:hypothetical protein
MKWTVGTTTPLDDRLVAPGLGQRPLFTDQFAWSAVGPRLAGALHPGPSIDHDGSGLSSGRFQ